MRKEPLFKSGEGMHYRWFEKDRETQDEFGLPKSRAEQPTPSDPPGQEETERIFTRGELTGIALASVFLLYSLFRQDIPMLLFSVAILLHALRKIASRSRHPRRHDLSNLLKGFSMSLFFGALLLLFL